MCCMCVRWCLSQNTAKLTQIYLIYRNYKHVAIYLCVDQPKKSNGIVYDIDLF